MKTSYSSKEKWLHSVNYYLKYLSTAGVNNNNNYKTKSHFFIIVTFLFRTKIRLQKKKKKNTNKTHLFFSVYEIVYKTDDKNIEISEDYYIIKRKYLKTISHWFYWHVNSFLVISRLEIRESRSFYVHIFVYIVKSFWFCFLHIVLSNENNFQTNLFNS